MVIRSASPASQLQTFIHPPADHFLRLILRHERRGSAASDERLLNNPGIFGCET